MNIFEVGGVCFEAVRTMRPRPHWRVKIVETGEVWEAGAAGVSNQSKPKMQADLQYLFERCAKREQGEFRRQLGLKEATK